MAAEHSREQRLLRWPHPSGLPLHVAARLEELNHYRLGIFILFALVVLPVMYVLFLFNRPAFDAFYLTVPLGVTVSIFFLILLAVVLYRQLRRRGGAAQPALPDRVATHATIGFLMLISGVISSLELGLGGALPTLIIMSLTIGVIFYLPVWEFILVAALGLFGFVAANILYWEMDPLAILGPQATLISLLAVGFFISRVLYKARVRGEVASRQLEESRQELEREVEVRRAAEASLKQERAGLEERVRERTRDLDDAVHLLTGEVEERRAAERHFRALFESVTDALLVLEEEQIVDCNSRALEVFAASQEELLGREVEQLAPPLQPNGQESRQLAQSHLQTALQGKRTEFEWRHRRLDGSLFDAEVSLRQVEGQPGRIIALVHDISERKQAERALRTSEANLARILDSMGDGVVVTDLEGRIQRMNPVVEELTGWSEEEALGRELDEVVQPVDATAEGSTRESGNHRIHVNRAGEPYHLSRSDGPLHDGQGQVVGQVHVLRDVSEEHRLAEQLRRAQKLEAIGRLTGGIAHDFNNLLTALTGNAELILFELDEDHHLRGEVEEMLSVADRASALTRQLLTFSRRKEVAIESVSLENTLQDMERMLRRVIGEDIIFELELPDAPSWVRADPVHLQQVVMNLAVNARDAMPDGGRLTMEIVHDVLESDRAESLGLQEGRYVRLTVRDTGVGMSSDVRERIFDPFFTTKEEGKGTGLGLATVYGIMGQCGGGIEVESEPGGGSSFHLYFREADSKALPESKEGVDSAELAGSERVLLVEDDASIRNLVVQVLERRGYTVHAARDGGEGLEWLEEAEQLPHLLITDLVMPRMGGVALATRVAERWPAMRILFISGYINEPLETTGELERVPHTTLRKPFRPTQLLQAVRSLLDRETVGG